MAIPVQLTVGLHTRVSVVEDHFHLSAPYSYWCWLAPSPTPSVLYNGFCDIMMKRSKTVPLFSSCSTAVSSKSFRNKVSLLCWCLKPAVDKVYGTLRTVLETLFCRCTYCGRQERYSKNTRPLKDCSKGTGEIKKIWISQMHRPDIYVASGSTQHWCASFLLYQIWKSRFKKFKVIYFL